MADVDPDEIKKLAAEGLDVDALETFPVATIHPLMSSKGLNKMNPDEDIGFDILGISPEDLPEPIEISLAQYQSEDGINKPKDFLEKISPSGIAK